MKRILKRFMPQTILLVLVAVFAVEAVSGFAAANGSTDNKVDLSLVMTPETQLTVYVDGQYSGALSESYGFGDTATITAPEVSGKTFSHWEADGSVISYAKELKLTMNAHTTLYAVYANEAPTTSAVAGFTSITRTNEGDKISFQATAGGGTVEGAGIVYSTTATGNNLKIGGGAGVTQVAAEKLTDSTTSMPDSILDNNNCWMLQIKPTGSSTVYHARAYVTVGGNTTYGDVKDVKLSELESGISMIANLEGFEPGTDDLLEEIAKNRANNPASVTNAPTAKNLNYNGQAQELVTAGTASGGEMQYALGTDATTAPANNLYTTSIPTGTDAGTYYVWYRVLGDVNHKDVPAVCIKAEIQKKTSSGGSTSGSSGGSTSGSGSSQTSTVENYTVPVSNESTVNVSTKISNNTAVVNEITQSDIDKITGNSTVSGNAVSGNAVSGNDASGKNTAIVIDVSGAKSDVTALQLTKSSLEKIAQALKDDNGINTLDIKLSGATVSFDKDALTALNDQAGGKDIKLVVTKTANTSLNDAQKEAVKNFTSVQPVKIYFESDGKELHDFKGGKASVSIKYTPEAGRDVKKYFVYYISEDGKLERFKTSYMNGYFSFVTGHFSEYAIVYDENAADTDTDDSALTGKAARYKNTLTINAGLKVSQTKSRINVKWGKVVDADGYDIYVQYCGKKFGDPVATIEGKTSAKIKTVNGEKLKLTKNFKVRVVAYKLVDGKKKVLCKTVVAHIVGRNNRKYSNPKKLTVKTKQLTLSAGETAKVKAKVVLTDPSKKSLTDKHASTFRYASSDKSVAKVDKKGNITAKSAGTCYIYVYARNGFAKKIKVTVE